MSISCHDSGFLRWKEAVYFVKTVSFQDRDYFWLTFYAEVFFNFRHLMTLRCPSHLMQIFNTVRKT